MDFKHLEPVFKALGLDSLAQISLVQGAFLAESHVPGFPTSAPALILALDSEEQAVVVKHLLLSVYPPEHPLALIWTSADPLQVEHLALEALDGQHPFSADTALFVPALAANTSFESFHEVVAHLRAPEGCPWDREQTHQSLRSGLLEETYEVLSALDAKDLDGLREELGDLLLHIFMQAQIATEDGEFNLIDVVQGIHSKIVSRHPHVFGELEIQGSEAVLQNWEKLKAAERQAKGKGATGLLDSVTSGLPAVLQAEQYQKRAARVGFDWPEIEGVLAKLEEELQEVKDAGDSTERAAEIGDLLFAVINLARWYKVDPESALRETNLRFKQRFGYIESQARLQNKQVSELTLAEMDQLWNEAKKAYSFK